MVLYANAALQASIAGMQKVLGHLKARGSLDGVSGELASFDRAAAAGRPSHASTISKKNTHDPIRLTGNHSCQAQAHNPHTRAIAQFISTIKYEDIPADVIARIKLLILDSLGCALYGSDLEWSRILRATLGEARHHQSLPRVGNAGASVGAACRAGQRHAHPELRARRRASPGRAACRRGHLAAAVGGDRAAARHERPRFPARRGRRLRDRPARRQMHGSAAYRAGLALRRDRRGVLRRGGRGRRLAAHQPSRPCTRSASPARKRPG